MCPLTVVGGVCGGNGAALSSDGMVVEAAPQRPQVARERRVRREVAWHLDAPVLEVAPPQKRSAQEEYRRLPVVCDSTGGMASLELDRESVVSHPLIDIPTPH